MSQKFKSIKNSAVSFLRDDEAATAAEYGILAALVAVAIIGAVTAFGSGLKDMFGTLTTKIQQK